MDVWYGLSLISLATTMNGLTSITARSRSAVL